MIVKRHLLLLLVILAVNVFIRFYELGNIPNGLSTDEADLGYNSYSILKTGQDVYGKKLPLFFQALDDYKPGLVFYSTVPAIALFGLSDFSVRVAPAIFGSLLPLFIFFLVRLLYPKNLPAAYLAMIAFTFAPWSVALGRNMIWYIELIVFFVIFLTIFLIGLKKNPLFLIAASFFLALTVYVYYAAIIYLPFILFVLGFIYRQDLKKRLKSLSLAIIVLSVLLLPAISHYLSGQSKTRLNAISVLTADITLPDSLKQIELDKKLDLPLSDIIHNRRLVYASALLDNYFDYFNLDYLFLNTSHTRYFYVNGVGLFYLIELPLVFYGAYIMIKRRQKADLLILSLALIGPVPAMITLGSPFPHRALLLIVAIQLISAVGITAFVSNILRAKREVMSSWSEAIGSKVSSRPARTIIALIIVVYAASIYFFLHQYFIHSPREFTSELDNGAWFATVRDAIPKVNQYKDDYDQVIFTWSQGKLVPAVYFLFYNKIDPRIIQAKSALWTREPPSYRQIYDKIENVEFRSINWEEDKNLKNTLLIGYPAEFPKDIEVIDATYLPNGNPHFLFVETQ